MAAVACVATSSSDEIRESVMIHGEMHDVPTPHHLAELFDRSRAKYRAQPRFSISDLSRFVEFLATAAREGIGIGQDFSDAANSQDVAALNLSFLMLLRSYRQEDMGFPTTPVLLPIWEEAVTAFKAASN